MEFLIGDKVEWASGNIISRGLIYGDDDFETIEVKCFEIGNRKASIKIPVMRNLLTKIE